MKKKRTIYDCVREAAVTMVNLQRDLHDFGLHATAKVVNEASQRLGWEAADKMREHERKSR